MSRSSSSGPWAAAPPLIPWSAPRGSEGSWPRGARFDLATVPPRDDESEEDVQTAEAGGHERQAPALRAEQRQGAQRHEAESHERHDPDREGATGDDAGAVEQEPGAGQRGVEPRTDQDEREQAADDDRREIAQHEAASGVGEHRGPGAARLLAHGPAADRQGDDGGGEPGGQA